MADHSIEFGDNANFESGKAIALANSVAISDSNNTTNGTGAMNIMIFQSSGPTSSANGRPPFKGPGLIYSPAESLAESQHHLINCLEAETPSALEHNTDPTQMAIYCFQIMNGQLQQDILDVGVGPAQFLTNAEIMRRWPKKLDEEISKELEHACTHWAKYLKKADKNNKRLVKKLENFVNKHLLHWIEALSWINKLDLADMSLRDAIAFLELKPTSLKTRKLLSEGQRLISNFAELIKQAALHIYHSALPLISNESLLYQTYRREMRINFCRVLSWWPKDLPTDWSQNQQPVNRIVFSHQLSSFELITRSQYRQPVNHIVFSRQPSSDFASWSGELLTLWDSTTGISHSEFTGERFALADNFTGAFSGANFVLLCNFLDRSYPSIWLDASAPVSRIAISSGGHLLAAGTSDGKIKVWDVAKRTLIEEINGFECHNQEYCQFAFSPDGPAGTRLVFSSDRGLKFRNIFDGRFVTNANYSPKMHFNLAFSSDGLRLASLVKEKGEKHILTVWNVVSGTLIGASTESVGSVLAISANGLLIVTGGDDHSLRLWSWNRKDHLSFDSPLDSDLSHPICCLAFSQDDDDILVIGFTNADSVLYDVKKRLIITTIPKHNPSAASFSPDRTRLAIAYRDGTLDLWDISSVEASHDMNPAKSASVSVLTFSPDCSHLICGFEDGIIRLWNTKSPSQLLAIRQGHSAKVTALAFRLNGELFVSGATDGTIRVWDENGSAFTDSFEFPNAGELTSVAFSGKVLAAATVDETILWDVLLRNYGSLSGSMFLSFSNPQNDPSHLLALFDKRHKDVRVWNIFANECIAQSQFSDIQTVEKMVFSPDNSQLVGIVRRDDGSERFCSFDFINKSLRYLQVDEYGGLCPMPRWHGIPVWLQYSGGNYLITGFFPADNELVSDSKIVVLPKNLVVDSCKPSCGSSMFALLCNDGRILLFKSLY